MDSFQPEGQENKASHTWDFRLFPVFVGPVAPPRSPPRTRPLCGRAISLGQVPRRGAAGLGHGQGSRCQVAVSVAAAPPPLLPAPSRAVRGPGRRPCGRVPPGLACPVCVSPCFPEEGPARETRQVDGCDHHTLFLCGSIHGEAGHAIVTDSGCVRGFKFLLCFKFLCWALLNLNTVSSGPAAHSDLWSVLSSGESSLSSGASANRGKTGKQQSAFPHSLVCERCRPSRTGVRTDSEPRLTRLPRPPLRWLCEAAVTCVSLAAVDPPVTFTPGPRPLEASRGHRDLSPQVPRRAASARPSLSPWSWWRPWLPGLWWSRPDALVCCPQSNLPRGPVERSPPGGACLLPRGWPRARTLAGARQAAVRASPVRRRTRPTRVPEHSLNRCRIPLKCI
ncbi:uncharacterized protein LOC128313592 [Acinonyx jubatus]|uniref:Uncharacterized protein LOC128313592 n=1 Tax=Acinonyx jubatus TaxID=32536 RepID=A0ABM3PBG9_ACIJB|nr:uncharacterized protein LOC128313592 [Acinonyx jubatus]